MKRNIPSERFAPSLSRQLTELRNRLADASAQMEWLQEKCEARPGEDMLSIAAGQLGFIRREKLAQVWYYLDPVSELLEEQEDRDKGGNDEKDNHLF